jgi:hypothetical protein
MTLQLFDLLLRGQPQLSAHFAEQEDLRPTIRRMLLLAVLGLIVHSLAVATAIHFFKTPTGWLSGGNPFIWAPAAFVIAFIGTLLICLPSFWFYTQLAGLDASFRLCTAQALRAQATTSVLLLGVMPLYFAVALSAGLKLFVAPSTVIWIGFALPFVVGLFGIRAVYRGFNDLLGKIPITHPRRGDFISRMVILWGGLYTTIAPVALYRLIQNFAGN